MARAPGSPKMGRDPNFGHLGGRDSNFRAVPIQKVVVGEMASTDSDLFNTLQYYRITYMAHTR